MAFVLYYNGSIITMRGEKPETAEAVLTGDGKILAVGTVANVMKKAEGHSVVKRDLKGRAMLPAFLDSHSHITAAAQVFGYASLEGADDFAEMIKRLSEYKEKAKIGPGEWIVGVGYDHNFLKEKRHPDKAVLDEAFPENPVIISHVSGHMGVVNSPALRLMQITAGSKNPKGGVIGRMPHSDEPDGYLEETAFTSAGSAVLEPSAEQMAKQFALAEQLYLKNGIATVQDGITRAKEWSLLKYMAERGLLHVDVVSYADMKSDKALLAENPEYTGAYNHHLRLGGYKIFLDGSPQGRTAWMSRPYEKTEENGADGGPDEENYRGYPVYQDEEVVCFFQAAFEENRQLLVHCNGDAAAQQMIDACESAARAAGCDLSRLRPVMIHAQLVRADQLKRMAELSITASFFVAHTYYWGDIHLKNFGRDRAMKISPLRTALNEHVNITLHQDSPVIEPDMPETLWCAVNRLSRGGVLMGGDEKISPYEALKAVTVNAAYQYGEESEKGTIEAGKHADFVILSANPLEISPDELREIRILETIKDGITLYRAGPEARSRPDVPAGT